LCGSVARTASQPLAAIESQSAKPAKQFEPQRLSTHSATLFGGGRQISHDGPHAAGFATDVHAPAQRWWRDSHVSRHVPSTHADVALADCGQAVVHDPQWRTSEVGSMQVPPQSKVAVSEQPDAHVNVPGNAPWVHTGSLRVHWVLHPPHEFGFDRSVSHPSLSCWLQFACPGSHTLTVHLLPKQTAVA
jgi:hypothetical protein